VLGKTAARHTSAEFVAFLADIVVNQPRGKEIHVIADNLSAHKTGQVDDFLNRHPKVHLHFTPTYSSWLNQIELWFAKIERDVIARGVFTSLADLQTKLMKYIRHYNKVPKTVKWRYFDPTRRITPSSAVTVHQLGEDILGVQKRPLGRNGLGAGARRRYRAGPWHQTAELSRREHWRAWPGFASRRTAPARRGVPGGSGQGRALSRRRDAGPEWVENISSWLSADDSVTGLEPQPRRHFEAGS
jgi:transposase